MVHSPLGELDREEFESVYNELVAELTSDPALSDVSETLKWLQTVLHYNLPDGKKVRGLLVPLTYKTLVPNAGKQELKSASVLGWCLEMLHASHHIHQDWMYERESRRGRACWYRVDAMGTQVINDALLMESALYQVLSRYFQSEACYDDLVELFLETTYKSILGHSLDARASKGRKMEEYTMKMYKSVVKYKTSYYTAWLPLALAMAMAGVVTDVRLKKKVEETALEIGLLSQVRKDVLNCFGGGDDDDDDDELRIESIETTGRDIRDGKITWLFVTAREHCSPAQLATLFENYGRGRGEEDEGAVALVKGLYGELDLAGKYKLYEAEMESRIGKMISGMEGDGGGELPQALFRNLVEMLKT